MADQPETAPPQPLYRLRVSLPIVGAPVIITDCVRIMRSSDSTHDITYGNPGSMNAVIVPFGVAVHIELVEEVPGAQAEGPKHARKR